MHGAAHNSCKPAKIISGYVLQSSILLKVWFKLMQRLGFHYSMHLQFKNQEFDINYRYLLLRDE